MRSIVLKALGQISGIRNGSKLTMSVGARSSVLKHRVRAVGSNGLVVGDDCLIQCRVSFDRAGAEVKIGDRCFIGASFLVSADKIDISDDVVISWGVTIVDHNSHALDWEHRRSDVKDWIAGQKRWEHVQTKAVYIKRRAWIGFGASILKGVTIGEGAVIGAQAVVTKDVPDYAVVAGNPARVVRMLEPATTGGFNAE